MATNKNSVNPLSHNVPIVNKDGTPTPEFMRKWQQQAGTNSSIPSDITTAAQVSAILDLLGLAEGDILFRGPTEWVVLAPGTAGYILRTGGPGAAPNWEGISAALDTLGSTKGDILFQDGTNWNVLGVPATDGWVLTFDHTTGLPVWKAPGGGGGVTIGSGPPTALAPAGTPYSQSDAAGLWVSTPTTSTGTHAVQGFGFIANNSVPGAIVMGAAPTPGNLIVLFLAWAEANQPAPTFNTADWTVLDSVPGIGGGNTAAFILYRYAQFGDTATLPALCTSGSSYWAAAGYEVAGVSGTIGTDVLQHVVGLDSGVNPVVPSPLTTTAASQLCLGFGGQYNGSAAQTVTGTGITTDANPANSGFFGSVSAFQATPASSGASFAPTIDFHRTDNGTTHAMLVINQQGATAVAGWTKVGPGGGGGSPDFLVPLAASFATHGNSPVLTDTPVGLGLSSPGNGGSNMYWAGMPQANVNFTILARVTQGILTDFTGEFGVFVRNTTSGKFLTAIISESTAVKMEQWTTDTSKNGDVANIGNVFNGFGWIKLTYNATSNLTSVYFSRDGANWTACGTDSTWVGVVDQIGICAPCQSGLNCPASGTVHYWSVT